tara:strand:- start:666 stop:989 length:324 start_codon:yes stop_codon:yes gene_type:complete
MAILDHDAIRKAYPEATRIDDSRGVFDKDGKSLTLEQSKIDAARITLDEDASKILYKKQRTGEAGTTDTIYLPLSEQLDLQYWDSVNGTTKWKEHIAAVKAKYPKPS